ncbi:MAG: chorismate mutase [Cryptosporangiaceae bacterium]|jgi:chorismate mutase|nr:chorismate mutase [Cryptosporangiaceae bacterium]
MTAPASQPATPAMPAESPTVQQASTGTDEPIDALRQRIDAVDAALIGLWRERAELSRRIGAARMASGGTRLVLAREQQIVDKYRGELGESGVQVAMLLLRAGRGPL